MASIDLGLSGKGSDEPPPLRIDDDRTGFEHLRKLLNTLHELLEFLVFNYPRVRRIRSQRREFH